MAATGAGPLRSGKDRAVLAGSGYRSGALRVSGS